MRPEQNAAIKNMLLLFSDPFSNKFNTFDENSRQALKDIGPNLYRKWYCCAIIDDTHLSPANIIDSMFGCEKDRSSYISVIDTTSFSDGKPEFRFKKQMYPGEVFLEDMKSFALLCEPASEFSYENYSDFRALSKTHGVLFNDDMYYAAYISRILLNLGMIVKMPSIHTEKYQLVREKFDMFFSLSPQEQMVCVVDTALDIFVEKLAQRLEIPVTKGTKAGIKEAICESSVTDALFSYVFKLVGIDFDGILELQEEKELSDEDEMLISTSMYAGVIFDKWLFTPLGYYMGLFRQVNPFPFNLREEIDFIQPVLLTGCDLSAELFTPCSQFYMLEGAEKIWGKAQSAEVPMLKKSIDESELKNIVEAGRLFEIMYYNSLVNSCYSGDIYRFKIYPANNSGFWKILDLPVSSTLYEFAGEISTYFGLFSTDFTFMYNKSEYSSRQRHRKLNSLQTMLSSLNLKDNSRLEYISDDDKSTVFVVETVGKMASDAVTIYPRLFMQSREVTLMERNDEF